MSGFHGPDLGPFQWDDPLLLEAQLTEDERMIRDIQSVATNFRSGEDPMRAIGGQGRYPWSVE